MDSNGMRIALVGWGVETKSAYNYYGLGHSYLIVSEEPKDDFPQFDNVQVQTLQTARKPGLSGNADDLSYLNDLENYDLIIFSPSARKNLEKIYSDSSPLWSKAKTTLEVLFEQCPTKNTIGVTGTKGKGTSTTLIGKFLESNGLKTHVGGNIGVPVLELLPNIGPNDWVVLELSSFQLNKFHYSPHIAVHLMIIPEHIDEWHKTMDDYVHSKRNIFANQTDSDIAVYNANNPYSTENVKASSGKHIPYLQKPGARVENDQIIVGDTVIIQVSEVALLGKHNLENICAAVTAVWEVHQNIEAYKSVIRSFTGLEHRLQLIRETDGVKYYDDSFGTTPDTAIVAMDAINQPKVMIVGGHDKGNDFTGMIKRLNSEDIRGVVCLGSTGKFIANQLVGQGFDTNKVSQKEQTNDWNMAEIINETKKFADSGDAVMLSTGSASFGIFKDYKDRGDRFIEVVNGL